MVDAALAKGIAIQDMYIDALVFPISVDSQFGNHCLQAIRRLREKYGPEVHITGGLSNVSFGLPCRHLINDAFIILATEAGADGGIIDPVSSHLDNVFLHRAADPAIPACRRDAFRDRTGTARTFCAPIARANCKCGSTDLVQVRYRFNSSGLTQ